MDKKTIITQELKVCCNGKVEQNLGHPKVFLTFNKNSKVAVCPYCSLVYEYNNK